MALNQSQREAVCHGEGPCLVLAGPGSGKTTVIVHRIEHLIREEKVRPDNILVITFTKYAAGEMRERFYAHMQGRPGVTFGTFHGIFFSILRWAYGVKGSGLLTREKKEKFLFEAGEDLLFSRMSREDMKEALEELAGEIERWKNRGMSESDPYVGLWKKEDFRRVAENYEEKKRATRTMDFEDMLLQCRSLFRGNPEALDVWQRRYTYILIDEFQDINPVQYDVVKMLAGQRENVFAVGDDDQSVYGFRGASPELMKRFTEDFPRGKVISLKENYRCSGRIVENACELIRHNKNRFDKKPVAVRGAGVPIGYVEKEDAIAESRWACRKMRRWLEEGTSPGDIGVLYRNALHARCLMDTMREEGIPFQTKDEMAKIYSHYICQDISAYFRLALGTGDREDMVRVANRPGRMIARESLSFGEGSFRSVKDYYHGQPWMRERVSKFERHVKMMSENPPYSAIQYLRKAVDYEKFIDDYGRYRGTDKAADMEILEEIQERSRRFPTMESWLEMISDPGGNSRKPGEIKGVRLMTMHASKGLEFDKVLIIHACEGMIPSDKARTDGDVEEERRLFYVALTRAKTQVIISSVRNKYGKERSVSRFLGEIKEKGVGA